MTALARRARWAVGALLAITATGAMLEVAFALDRPGELAWYRLVSFSYTVAGVLVFVVVAKAILDREPGHPVGWLLLLFACYPGASVLANCYTAWELLGSALITWLLWSASASSVVVLAGAIMLFPIGRLPSPRWSWLVRAAAGVGVASVVLAAVTPWPYPPYPNDTYFAENPVGLVALQDVYGAVLAVGFLERRRPPDPWPHRAPTGRPPARRLTQQPAHDRRTRPDPPVLCRRRQRTRHALDSIGPPR